MRINQRFERIVSVSLTAQLAVKTAFHRRKGIDVMLQRAVKPIGQRRIRYPGMFWSNVIRHHVKKNLHSLFVRGCDEFLIILYGTEMWIDSVEVHSPIPVIVLRGS